MIDFNYITLRQGDCLPLTEKFQLEAASVFRTAPDQPKSAMRN